MSDHPVKRKLRRDILPYLVSSRELRRQWFYRWHGIFGYTTDILVGLTAVGLGSPLFVLFVGNPADPNFQDSSGSSFKEALGSIPQPLFFPLVVLGIAWVVMRVAFAREEGQKRAVLAKSCIQTLRQSEARLHRLLTNQEPMRELNKLIDEQIAPTVDRNIQENSWPWTGPAPGIDAEVERQLAELCTKYESDWAPAPLESIELRTAA